MCVVNVNSLCSIDICKNSAKIAHVNNPSSALNQVFSVESILQLKFSQWLFLACNVFVATLFKPTLEQ